MKTIKTETAKLEVLDIIPKTETRNILAINVQHDGVFYPAGSMIRSEIKSEMDPSFFIKK